MKSKARRGTSSHTEGLRRLDARTLWLWALANTVVGLLIGSAIHLFAGGDVTASGLIPMSVVFANVVGFAAILTARFVLPHYSGMPAWLRLPLAGLTLVAGGVLGSGLALLVNPLVVLYQMRLAVMVLTINGALALIVGIGAYTYEQMRRIIERDASERGRFEH